ncbi:hypothetical protein ABR965_01105 [Photorhabdus laumondii]
MIAQALRLHETTINRHISDYLITANSNPTMAALRAISAKHRLRNLSLI